jgi:hypothetical protein
MNRQSGVGEGPLSELMTSCLDEIYSWIDCWTFVLTGGEEMRTIALSLPDVPKNSLRFRTIGTVISMYIAQTQKIPPGITPALILFAILQQLDAINDERGFIGHYSPKAAQQLLLWPRDDAPIPADAELEYTLSELNRQVSF